MLVDEIHLAVFHPPKSTQNYSSFPPGRNPPMPFSTQDVFHPAKIHPPSGGFLSNHWNADLGYNHWHADLFGGYNHWNANVMLLISK